MYALPVSLLLLSCLEFLPREMAPGSEEIPFRLHRDYMILVEGRIGRLDGLTFLIDTGSSAPVLSTRTAKRLGCERQSRKMVAYGREIKTECTILRNLRIGSIRFGPVPALIADLASLLPQIGNRIDAVIGMNALIRVPFRVDFDARVVMFRPANSLPHSIAIEFQNNLPVVNAVLERQPVRLLLDTGAAMLIVFAERHKGIRKKKVFGSREIYHLGTQDLLKRIRFSELSLGTGYWKRVDAYRLDRPARHYPGITGIAGVSSFGFRSVQFNWEQAQMSWVP